MPHARSAEKHHFLFSLRIARVHPIHQPPPAPACRRCMRLDSRREKQTKRENGWEWRPFPCRYRVSAACFIGLLNYTVFGLRFIRACTATTLKCLLLKTSMNRFMSADSILSDHLDKTVRVLHSCGI